MDLIPWTLVKEGGPWAALLTVIMGIFFLHQKGTLVTGGEVDRTIAGYRDSLDRLEKELVFWRDAARDKDLTIQTQADQLHKLMAYSAVGTHALEDIVREARRRDVDA